MAEVIGNNEAGTDERNAFEMVRMRADAAGIPTEDVNSPHRDDTYLVLFFPAGQDRRRVPVFDESAARALLATPFEHFSFLGDYEAICSYDTNYMEALVGSASVTPGFPLMRFRELLEGGVADETPSEDIPGWVVARESDGASVRIGRSSQAFRALGRGPGRPERGLTLQIQGVAIDGHDAALAKLETLANSVFFQIETRLGIPLSLRRRRFPSRGVRRPHAATLEDLKFPTYEYDAQPISLYWYGASAVGMPLLQFLAYYQAIEFYFPVYSEHEARRRLRYVLKDPLFDAQSDVALGRLMSVIAFGRGKTFGAERDQLKATVEECVTESELVAFIREVPEREEFFRTKHPSLSDVRLRVGEGAGGIREQVSERLYDVRCRIVHAKESERHPEAIFPFSREADLLGHDIELAQFLARRVLIASSRPISL